VDIKNWRGNRGKAGFLDDERAHLDGWLAKRWVDLGREHGGPGPGPYTWWSWRGKSFDTDGGWRIDYALATVPLAEHCTGATVGRAASYDERWSDHAPLTVTFA
jgi:exodeoxyribonuclease-3